MGGVEGCIKLRSEVTETEKEGLSTKCQVLKGPETNSAVVRTLRLPENVYSRFKLLIMPFDLLFRQGKKGRARL